MIIVTGATGRLGRAIVERLLDRVPAGEVGVSVRDPAKAQDLAARGVRVRRGDFDDAESLRHAFEGATRVLLVSSNARATGGDPLAQHRTAIAAAAAAGVGRLLYTSHMAASAGSRFPPARDHAATEAMLAASGLRWTALRHGFYAESALAMIGEGLARGVIEAPMDGPVSWTTHADLAEADAAILAGEAGFDGPTPPLTAAEAIDLEGLAAIASEVLGRPVARRVLDDGAMPERVAARGLPARAVEMVMGLYLACRAGEFAAVDPTLERLVGHRPIPMRALMAERLRPDAAPRA